MLEELSVLRLVLSFAAGAAGVMRMPGHLQDRGRPAAWPSHWPIFTHTMANIRPRCKPPLTLL